MTQLDEQGTTFARYQIVNAVIWASTLMGVAVVAKATDEFIYLLLVLVVGSTASWAAIWGMLVRGGTTATLSRNQRQHA